MIIGIIRQTGNVYRRETGVQSYLQLKYEGNMPCTGSATCNGGGNHVDTPSWYDWVEEAKAHPETWHHQGDTANLNIRDGAISRTDYEFAMAKFAQYSDMPVRGTAMETIEKESAYALKLIESLRPRVK